MPTLDYGRSRPARPTRRRAGYASITWAAVTFVLGVILHAHARADGTSPVTAACCAIVVIAGVVGAAIGLAAIIGRDSRWLGFVGSLANLAAAAVGGLRLALLA